MNPDPTAKTIDARTFQKLTGISIGRLQRWSEAGTIQPNTSGRGKCHGRRFSLRDALRATFMLELTDRGVSTRTARALMRRIVTDFLSEQETGDAGNLVAVIFGATRETAGRVRIHEPRARLLPSAAAVKVITDHKGPTYLIPVSEMSEQLRDRYQRSKLTAFTS